MKKSTITIDPAAIQRLSGKELLSIMTFCQREKLTPIIKGNMMDSQELQNKLLNELISIHGCEKIALTIMGILFPHGVFVHELEQVEA